MTVERIDPPRIGGEREMLERWLDYHRATLLIKCSGPRRRAAGPPGAVPPSTLSLLGLVRHMADVERSSLPPHASTVRTHQPIFYTQERPETTTSTPRTLPAPTTTSRCSSPRSRRPARRGRPGTALDDTGVSRRGGEVDRVRWIYLHMIEEYARHNGHADLLRECIDGATGD